MSFHNSNTHHSPNGDDIFLKCLSQFYKNEYESSEGLIYRKLKLRDAVVKAYNKKFKTKLKAFELIAQLKENEKSYQPYEWQKLFLDVFDYENDEAPILQNQAKLTDHENIQKIKTEQEAMNVSQGAQMNTTKDVFNATAKSSGDAVVSVECKPDIPIATQDMDYKSMSTYELKRALLLSKLEMLDAQETLRKAKESIKLNEEEHLKRIVDKK